MDWFVEYSVKHDYKIARANYGPFVNSVDLLHPDVAKLGLGSGQCPIYNFFMMPIVITYYHAQIQKLI